MTYGSKRKIKIFIILAGASLLWFLLGWGLIACSEKHEWLSSFVEITFALNTSLIINKTRNFLINLFSSYREKQLLNAGTDMLNNGKNISVGNLSDLADKLEKQLTKNINNEMKWIPRLGVIVACLSLLLLLIDCSDTYCKFVPMLLLPVVWFYVGALMEFWEIKKEFNVSFANGNDNNKVNHKNVIAQIQQVVPNTEAKS